MGLSPSVSERFAKQAKHSASLASDTSGSFETSQCGSRANVRISDRHRGHTEKLTADTTNDLLQDEANFVSRRAQTVRHKNVFMHVNKHGLFSIFGAERQIPKLDQDLCSEAFSTHTLSKNTSYTTMVRL